MNIYKYYCKKCNYGTKNKYDYNKHCKTKKHGKILQKHNNSNSATFCHNSAKTLPKKSVYFTCEYCDNTFKKANKARHYQRCKEKKSIHTTNNITNNITNNTNNTNINNDNRVINMYYVINNFTDALNYNDLMNKPLTNEEKNYTDKNGAILGCNNLISNRCIDDIDINKRPFHCVDESRLKFILRNNDKWQVDSKGEQIMDDAIKLVNNNYETTMKDDKFYDNSYAERINKNIAELIELQKKGKKKIAKELSKKTLLKNNVDNTIEN